MLEPDVGKAIELHEKTMEITEGERKNLLKGKEGLHLLDSAIQVVFQSFGSIECYPEPIDKAARLLVGIIKNHPFIDGNKRTAFVLFKELLREYGLTVRGYKIEEVVEFLEKIAASQERIEILCNETKKFFNKWLIRLVN